MGLKINPTTGNLDVVNNKAKQIKIAKLNGTGCKNQEYFNSQFGGVGRVSDYSRSWNWFY